MARSTYMTFLMTKASGGASWSKVVDIKEFPDLGGEPELLETTTLSNKMQTYIPGIQGMDGLTFTANYTKADYSSLLALANGEHDFAVWFGGTEGSNGPVPSGSEGKFEFKGTLSVFVNGGGVNEVVNMTVTIAPSTDIVMSSGT